MTVKFTIGLVGDSGTGKTSLIQQMKENKISLTHYGTVSVKTEFISLPVDDEEIEFTILDTPGGVSRVRPDIEKLASADIFVIVCSVTDQASFGNVGAWRALVDEAAGGTAAAVLLLGNKADLESQRAVGAEEAEECAEAHNCAYLEVTATDHAAVAALMDECSREVLRLVEAMASLSTEKTGGLRGVQFREVKMHVVGESCAGCSAFVTRFADDKFEEDDFEDDEDVICLRRLVKLDGWVRISLFDVPESLIDERQSIPGLGLSEAVLFVADLTDRDSLEALGPLARLAGPNAVRALIGTKSDLAEAVEVTPEDIQRQQDAIGACRYFEVSAKTGAGVRDAVEAVARLVLERQ